MKRRLLPFFLLVSSFAFAQNNIYRSGGITQTVGAPTFVPGASGNIVAIDTVTGEWYVNPNRLSGSSWISAGYRLTNISGSVPPAYTPTAHQSHFVVNAANELYYWDGSTWQSVGGGGSTDALRLKFLVVNKSGVTLNKGEVVYVSGAQGNRVAVKKALASADSVSANTLGVMDETVANNGEGYCVAEGLVSGINTSAFTEGAALYLSPTTAGAITQTKPTAPNHLVLIGYCVKSNAGSGEISVHIQNGYELGELHDVYLPAPGNGQVLTYNGTNSRWEAATVADQSATNEIQRLDTFSLSGQTLSASLLNDGVAASSVTLPIVDVVAGTNVTVTKSNGVATVSATGGGSGGSPAGSTGQIQFNNAGAFGASANLAWDNSAAYQLNIGAPSLPTGKLNVKGGGTTSGTVNLRLTDSGNTELLKVLDNGSTNIGSNFAWDNTNNRLNIGNLPSPAATLNVKGAGNSLASGNAMNITNSDNKSILRARNDGVVLFGNTSSILWFPIADAGGGANTIDGTNFSLFSATTNQAASWGRLHIGGEVHTQTSGDVVHMYLHDRFSPTSGTATTSTLRVNTQINQTGGANGITRGIYLTPSLTSAADWRTIEWNNNSGYGLYGIGTANNYLAGNTVIGTTTPSARLHIRGSNTSGGTNALLVQNSTPSDICRIENDGKISYFATNTAAGTTGAQTIDRPSGTVNFAAGATSLVVTNALCTTSSIVLPVIRTNDATATIKNVVPGAGSFTINLNAAATNETSVGFFIIN